MRFGNYIRIDASSVMGAAYDPIFSEPGGVMSLCAQHSEIITTSAAVSSPADISTASWSRTDCAASSSSRLVVGAAPVNPNLMQVVTNAGDGNPCIPMLLRFQTKYESIPFICLESRGLTAANRTWFDIQNGVLGTNGASHQGASISAPDGNGKRTVQLRVVINGGTPIIRVHLVTADNVLTSPAQNTAIELFEDPAMPGWLHQVRGSSWADRLGAGAVAQATISIQPGYGIMPGAPGVYDINGKPAFRGANGPGRMLGVIPPALAALNGTAPNCTVGLVGAFINADLIQTLFGIGTAAQAANGARAWGTVNTGNGRVRHQSVSDAGVIVTSDDSVDLALNTSPKRMIFRLSGGSLWVFVNGTVLPNMNGVPHAPGAINADRLAVFCRPTSGQIERANALLGAVDVWDNAKDDAAVQRIDTYYAQHWGF